MKTRIKYKPICRGLLAIGFGVMALGGQCYGQDSPASASPADTAKKETPIKRVKNTFYGNMIIDNQTVMVSAPKTFEFTMQHRFGTINNGYSDMYGIFAEANIRLGWAYTPIKNMQLGIGITKENMQWDGNIKYALTRQAVSGGCPISATFYGDMAVSTLKKAGNFVSDNDRISYFGQLIFARKVTDRFSVQVSPSLSYYNNVQGYVSADGTIQPQMNNAQVAIAFMGSYMLSDEFGVVVNYDQPLTQNPTNNPHPNISFGVQIATFTHTFQIFLCNFQHILPQANNFFNQNDYTKSQYLLGFNIAKDWNF